MGTGTAERRRLVADVSLADLAGDAFGDEVGQDLADGSLAEPTAVSDLDEGEGLSGLQEDAADTVVVRVAGFDLVRSVEDGKGEAAGPFA